MEQASQMAGVHRATLHRWERGHAQPRLPELEALLGALGASPQQSRQAVTLVDAPRARALVRLDLARMAEQSGLGPMPHGGELLRAMRLRRGWSLDEVAARMGVTASTVRRWEGAETWPAAEQLHQLCYTLEAKLEEMLALTCGQFSRLSPTPGTTDEGLAERVARFSRTLRDPPFGLKDLELLTLRAEAWRLAARSSAGLRLLADVYCLTSGYLSYRDRYSEAVAAAERYFELVPEQPPERRARSGWQCIRMDAATNRLGLPGRMSSKRCLDELRVVLPLTRGTQNEPIALSQISEVLLRQGARDSALQVSEEARQAAQRALGDEGAAWYQGLGGVLLIQSGRFVEGLSLLSTGQTGDWYRLVETSLWKAEALAGLGEQDQADSWLTRAQADLTRYEITPLQPRLDGLRAQLHGERAAVGPGPVSEAKG